MTGPVRIQLRRVKGWRMPENTVKVDRTTRWGNPFREGAGGMSRAMCVALFETLLLSDISDADVGEPAAEYRRWVMEHIGELKGKNLACWCAAPQPYERDACHAAVLLRLANGDGAPSQ